MAQTESASFLGHCSLFSIDDYAYYKEEIYILVFFYCQNTYIICCCVHSIKTVLQINVYFMKKVKTTKWKLYIFNHPSFLPVYFHRKVKDLQPHVETPRTKTVEVGVP